MRKLSWFILIIFLTLLIGFCGAIAYISSPDVKNWIDGSGIGPMISGWGNGIGYSITTNPFWMTYIAPPMNSLLIFGGITFFFGILAYRYVYEKGIRERAIRDAFDSRGSQGMVTTGPTSQTPITATTRPTATTPQQTTPQLEVPASPPPEEKAKA